MQIARKKTNIISDLRRAIKNNHKFAFAWHVKNYNRNEKRKKIYKSEKNQGGRALANCV